MRTRAWVAFMAVVAAACGVGASSASAETVTFSTPISGSVLNECITPAEEVFINGTAHFKFTDNSLDGIKSQIEINVTGVKGVTLTGVRYAMNDQTSAMTHADVDDAQVTVEQTSILTRQGETGTFLVGDDFRLHTIAHLTVSNGVTRAEKVELRADCR